MMKEQCSRTDAYRVRQDAFRLPVVYLILMLINYKQARHCSRRQCLMRKFKVSGTGWRCVGTLRAMGMNNSVYHAADVPETYAWSPDSDPLSEI